MTSEVLGRTNQPFPNIWLSLGLPEGQAAAADLASVAADAGCPLDISHQPGLWGSLLRGCDSPFLAISSGDIERATDEKHAADLVQAHLIETLCCVGRETVDFYCLRVRRHLDEFQISGALEALESARQEGHIRFVGLWVDEPNAGRSAWQIHDAFDVAVLPRSHYVSDTYVSLAPLAKERRVGLVTRAPFDWGYGLPFFQLPQMWRLRNLAQSFYGLTLAQAVLADLLSEHPVLVPVSTAGEARAAVDATQKVVPDDLHAMLGSFKEELDRPALWAELLESPDSRLRDAARRRLGGSRTV